MDRGQKIIIIVSIAIVSTTAVIIGLVAPAAYTEQCKQKARELVNNLYEIEGGSKQDLIKSFEQESLSTAAQKDLQNLKKVFAQCPELKSMSQEELGADISFLGGSRF
jgi:hypothetical protein